MRFLRSKHDSKILHKKSTAKRNTLLQLMELENRIVPSALNYSPSLLFKAPKDIIFVDANIRDQIPNDEYRNSNVIMIQRNEDAIEVITKTMASNKHIGVLRIICHGDNGTLLLGKTVIDTSTVFKRRNEIVTWANALSADADILLYGCNVASGDSGILFVQTLAGLTSTDVAASNNITGSNGDISLEFSSGFISNTIKTNKSSWDLAKASLSFSNINGTTFFVDWFNGSANTFTFLSSLSGSKTYSLASGILPSGISLDASSGILSGQPTPNSVGIYQLTIRADNGFSQEITNFSLTISSPLMPNQQNNSAASFHTGSGLQKPNILSFTAIKSNGSLVSWGDTGGGGIGYPTTTGNIIVNSSNEQYAVINANGSITAWGNTSGGITPPSGNNFSRIYSNSYSMAALQNNGKISTWGTAGKGGNGAPTDSGYAAIFSNNASFVGFKMDGTLAGWGSGSTGTPTGSGWNRVFPNTYAYTAIKAGGFLKSWGDSTSGGIGNPTVGGFINVYATGTAFAALKSDGSIVSWGNTLDGGFGAPAGNGYIDICRTLHSFAALKSDGSIYSWGNASSGGTGTPIGTGFVKLFATRDAFAAIRSDGSISSWGDLGGNQGPTDSGYISISATGQSFAALKNDGSIYTWGYASWGGTGGPQGANFKQIHSNMFAFVALKNDGTVYAWGESRYGGSSVPTNLNDVVAFASPLEQLPWFTHKNLYSFAATPGVSFSFQPDVYGIPTAYYSISSGTLPEGINLNPQTGQISGVPISGSMGFYSFSLTATNSAGSTTRQFEMRIFGEIGSKLLPNERSGQGGLAFYTGSGTNLQNSDAFAALDTSGNPTAWGSSDYGGSNAILQSLVPNNRQFNQVYATMNAFAGLRTDGSVASWGALADGGSNAPTGTGFISISSTLRAFAALKSDGSIEAWGNSGAGGQGAPTGNGFIKIFSGAEAFAAIKDDGSIFVWGDTSRGGASGPTGNGYFQIIATRYAFAALRNNGTISVWGNTTYGGTGAPTGSNYISIYSNGNAFTALKSDGSLTAWGHTQWGGTNGPTGNGFVHVFSSPHAFAAIKNDGSIKTWGYNSYGGTGGPLATGYSQVAASAFAFAALKSDGSIFAWGDAASGATGAPTDSGYIRIFSNPFSFTAIKSDGSIRSWGATDSGGAGAPSGIGFKWVYPAYKAFTGLRKDGTIVSWGATDKGGSVSSGLSGIVSISSALEQPVWFAANVQSIHVAVKNIPFNYKIPVLGIPSASYVILTGTLAPGLSLAKETGLISGIPTTVGTYSFTISADNGLGLPATKAFTLTVNQAPSITSDTSIISTYGSTKNIQIAANGVPSLFTFSIQGNIPSGVTINSNTGIITVEPTTSAGSYSFNIMVSNGFGTPASETISLNIARKILTVTADDKSKNYDGLVFTAFTSSISGYVNSESVANITVGTISYIGSAVLATNSGVSIITPVLSGFSADNYVFEIAAGTLTINKAALTLTADNKNKTYNGSVFSGYTYAYTGFVNGETVAAITPGTVTYTGTAITANTAGSYVITPAVSGFSATNYNAPILVDGTLNINKVALTLTAENKAKTYDGSVFSGYSYIFAGFVNNESVSDITPGTITFTGTAIPATAAGSYVITPSISGFAATNYNTPNLVEGILTINKATLTVTPDAKAKTYDGLVFTGFTSTISGYVNSETNSVITGTATYSGAATSAIATGTYASITAVVSSMSANNYTIVAGAAATLTINKATLTVTPDSKSKTYDGVASTGFSSSYTGFVNSENGSVVTGTAGFGGTAIGAVAAGSYTIIATSGTLSAANYDLVFQAGTLTINKALLSVTADNKTKTYDGLTFSAFTSVISGFVGTEDLSAVSGSIGYLGAAVSATGTGNYTILPTSGTLSAANYAFSFSSGVLSIGKATLSVLADNKSKTYNGQVFTEFTYTLLGFVNGEGPSLVNGSLAFGGDARAATNAGDYQIIPTAGTLMAVNYAFNFLPGTLTINKAVLTVTADNRSKTYDGQPSTGFTASYTGFANGENASVISGVPGFSGTAIGVVAAGNYPINPTPGNITASNYDFAFQAGTLVINKALLTVTADNKTKTYDGQVFTAFSSVINGFVNNEDLSAVSGSAGYLGAATSATATGTYPILPTTGSLSAANYAFAFSQGALTIGKATLTVSADNKIKIYDGQVFSAFTYTLTGFANGDGPNLVTGSSSIGGNARFAINAGEYQIVPTVGTLSASNYTFNFASGILTISKAILLVTAGNFTKTYDGLALNGFTSAITGFVNGENMSVVSGIPGYSGTGATASVAGSHALSPTVGTLAAANYTFALQDGLVTINRAPLMVTADSITKTYDGQVYTSFTTSFNGFVNVENAIVVTGTASFSGSAMTATQVGQYEIAVTLGTLSASNYVLSFTPGTLTINKALLTLTADNKSKTYDGLGFSAFSANVSGFVNGETAAVVLTGNPLFKGPATTATQKGQYLIVPEAGTLHASNYRFATFVTGSLDILRSGPMVTGAQTANFIVNQMLAIPAFRVSDPDSGLLGILDITVTTTRGKITIGSNTAQSITFANTILSANQMLAKIKYTTATDSFLNATISVTAQDRDAAGAVVGSWTMSLAPSAGIFAKIQDPSKPGKTSLVVQGSVKNESIVVKPVSASNLTSYTVSMTGMATQVFTGITGRILAYASGGDDTINVSAVKISTLLSGGEGNDIILGGSAADTIFGNGGNDLLIGGLGADIINGDYGNDILVDGSVTFKSKTDTLDKVLATWNSLPAPTTSIYNNITARLSVDFDKLNNDTMGGGNGIDWFWSTTTGAVADTIGIFTGEKRRTI